MKLFTATLMIACLSATTISAQELSREQPASQQRTFNEASSTDHGQGQNLDAKIAACLYLGNQEEVALATFAQKHAQHEDVKMFAKMLADEHTKALGMIQKASPEVANLKLTTGDRNAGDATPEGKEPGIAMLQKVKSECLSLTMQELQEYQDAEFDKAYVGQQVGAHIAMLAELRGSKSFASPELQKLIAQGEEMTVAHMEKAKEIMGQIKDQRVPKSAERPTEDSKR
jgi:predicted outer membrane protein